MDEETEDFKAKKQRKARALWRDMKAIGFLLDNLDDDMILAVVSPGELYLLRDAQRLMERLAHQMTVEMNS